MAQTWRSHIAGGNALSRHAPPGLWWSSRSASMVFQTFQKMNLLAMLTYKSPDAIVSLNPPAPFPPTSPPTTTHPIHLAVLREHPDLSYTHEALGIPEGLLRTIVEILSSQNTYSPEDTDRAELQLLLFVPDHPYPHLHPPIHPSFSPSYQPRRQTQPPPSHLLLLHTNLLQTIHTPLHAHPRNRHPRNPSPPAHPSPQPQPRPPNAHHLARRHNQLRDPPRERAGSGPDPRMALRAANERVRDLQAGRGDGAGDLVLGGLRR